MLGLRNILTILSLVYSKAELFFAIVYSERTPSGLLKELSDLVALESQYWISLTPMSENLAGSLDFLKLNAVFDFTYSVTYETQLKTFSYSHRLLYFSDRVEKEEWWGFGLHASFAAEAKAINALLEYLDWENPHFVFSEKLQSKSVHKYLSRDPLSVLPRQADQQVFDNFVGRGVKPSGNWKVVVVSDSESASKTLQALKNSKIYKERCGFVASVKGAFGDLDVGAILIAEEGLELSKTEGEYEFKSILRAIDILHELSKEGAKTDNRMLRDLLEERTDNHVISNYFCILNYNGGVKTIGNITDKLIMFDKIIFPGNVTEFNRTPPIINISGNLGLENYDGTISGATHLINSGILPMIDIINDDSSLLANFELQIYGTDCGPEKFDYKNVSNCMEKHKNNLGAFYIDSPFENVVKGNIDVFRDFGITIPHTGIFVYDWTLFNKIDYPELFITTPHQMYMFAILPYILNTLGWKEVLVYFDDHVDRDPFEAFMKNAEILGISILNENMFIPYYSNQTFRETNKEALKEAISLKCRIYVNFLGLPNSVRLMESLYDLGVTKNEALFILKEPFSDFIEFESIYRHDKGKILKIADGSLSLFINEYTGEYGESLQKEIAQALFPGPTSFTCPQIDSLLLGVYAIDLMLRIGRDYEDPSDLDYFMRQMKFTGCSGTVSIDSGGNGRNEIAFTLRNFYVTDEGDGKWEEKVIGNYTIGVMVPLVIDKNIVWADGSTELPESMIKKPKCGIEQSEIQYNKQSILLTVYLSVGYFVIVLGTSFVIWFKKLRTKHKRIHSERELMFEDGVQITTVFVEASTYTILGPDVSIVDFLSSFVRLDSYLRFEGDLFWRIAFLFSGFSLLWSLCFFFAITMLDRKFPKGVKDFSRYIGLTMLPLFTKLGFVLLLWIHLRIFECKQAKGEDLEDSFLANDCETSCWEGFHLVISIVFSVILIFFSVISSMSGIVYDEVMDHVNIKTNSFFSFCKTMFSIFIVFLSFILKEIHPKIFGGCYFLVFVFWTIFCFKRESFNYVRLILWQNLTVLGVCCHCFFAGIQQFFEFSALSVAVVDLILIVSLGVLTLILQHLFIPGYLYKKKGRDFNKLLKFAYTNKMKAQELTLHELDYSFGKEYKIRQEEEVRREVEQVRPITFR